MQLQTIIDIPAFSQKITYQTPVLFIGSCFAANIGNAMLQRRFPAMVNPFGVVYNPQSVAQSLQRLRSGMPFIESDLVCCNGLWTTFAHHSSFSHPDKTKFLVDANEALKKGHEALNRAQYIVVSLGTSWAYRHRERNAVVSNCHKFPAADFERVFLSSSDAMEILAREIAAMPHVTWIFTVSPIRHWKDGAHGNQLSKANLLITVEQLQQRFPNVYYFPAYEIMMDELRDYRFYADDMLHPSAQAIDYIWDRFSDVIFDDGTKKIVREVESVVAAQQHRPLHPNTDTYKKFADTFERKITDLKTRYPFLKI